MTIYRTKHFTIHELVDPVTHAERGQRAWELLRPEALMTLDVLREKFGPIIVNNWHGGGQYRESGFRRHDSTTGAKWSMHRFGGAFDCKPRACTPKDIFDYVLAHPDEFPHLNRMENVVKTVTWLHFDVANSDTRIKVFDP